MTIQEVAQSAGVLTAVVAGIRWLLGFYFRKSTELEQLKATHRTQAENSIAADIANVKGVVAVFRNELNDLKLKMADYSGQLRENGRIMEVFQKQWERTAENLQARYHALENADIVKVGENTFIFKTRNSGRG